MAQLSAHVRSCSSMKEPHHFRNRRAGCVSFSWIAITSGMETSVRPSWMMVARISAGSRSQRSIAALDAAPCLGAWNRPDRGPATGSWRRPARARRPVIDRVERVDVKRGDGSAGPDTQVIDGGTGVARDSSSKPMASSPGSRPTDRSPSAWPSHRPTSQRPPKRTVWLTLPRGVSHTLRSLQPAARDLALPAVACDHLREDAVVVPDAVTDCRILKRGERSGKHAASRPRPPFPSPGSTSCSAMSSSS